MSKFVDRLRAVQRELFAARPQLKTSDFEISDKDALCLQVAGLCHDLGHGPLSHVFETYFIQKIRGAEDAKKVGLPECSEDAKKVPEDSEDAKKVHVGSEDAKKVPEGSEDAKKIHVHEGSEDAKKVHEGSEDAKKVPKSSEDAKKVHEGSEDAKKIHEGSEDAKKVPEGSEDAKKVPEGSEDEKKIGLPEVCEDVNKIHLHTYKKYATKWTHEEATCDLLDHLWKDGVFRHGSVALDDKDLKFIKELIYKTKNTCMSEEKRETLTGRSIKKDFLYEIISNDENRIDVDKWDYFARDCYHLGFQNNFDHNRLIQFSRLIEVEKEGIGKRWHICYREKELENLYHMFYSRVILHKRACLHKTTKIIEIMYMEALEKVNAYLKIKGTTCEEAKCEGMKISDCISDSVAYCKLTDNIFDRIRLMGEESSTKSSTTGSQNSGSLEERSQAIKQAIQILDDIENRKLYKFIGEAIPPGGIKFDKESLRDEEYKVEEEIMGPDDKKLTRADFLINILEFSYGGKSNPVDNVYFYVKSNPDEAISIKREQVSLLLPNVYGEQVVRMYSRKLDAENVKQCRIYFEKWCREKEMEGKWKLYETDGHATKQ